MATITNKAVVELTKILDADGDSIVSFDAITKLDTTSRNSLSKYPVEDGTVITENTTKDNLVITLSGVISVATVGKLKPQTSVRLVDEPLLLKTVVGAVGRRSFYKKPVVKNVTTKVPSYKVDKVDDARESLQSASDKRMLVELRSSSKSYNSLVITSLNFTKDLSTGSDSLRIDLKLEQVAYAFSSDTQRSRFVGPIQPTVDKGTTPTSKVTTIEDGVPTGNAGRKLYKRISQ